MKKSIKIGYLNSKGQTDFALTPYISIIYGKYLKIYGISLSFGYWSLGICIGYFKSGIPLFHNFNKE